MLKLLMHTDMAQTLAYMNRHGPETAIMLANLQACGLENRGSDGKYGDYFGYYCGAELQGIIVFYNSGSSTCHFVNEKAAADMSMLLAKRNGKSLHGLKPLIDTLLAARPGRKPVRSITESEYLINSHFKPYILAEAQFLTAGQLGGEQSALYIAQAYYDGLRDAKSLHEIKKKLQTADDGELLFLLAGGTVKALAYTRAAASNVAHIAGVYTFEAARGGGYGKAITSELCARSLSSGKTPALIVRKDNRPALKVYASVGFSHYADYTIVQL